MPQVPARKVCAFLPRDAVLFLSTHPQPLSHFVPAASFWRCMSCWCIHTPKWTSLRFTCMTEYCEHHKKRKVLKCQQRFICVQRGTLQLSTYLKQYQKGLNTLECIHKTKHSKAIKKYIVLKFKYYLMVWGSSQNIMLADKHTHTYIFYA